MFQSIISYLVFSAIIGLIVLIICAAQQSLLISGIILVILIAIGGYIEYRDERRIRESN